MNLLQPINALRISYHEQCLEATDERLFPISRHRSKRIQKKLLKRFGGEFVKQPAIFKTPQGLIAHPSLRAQIEAKFKQGNTNAK